MAKSAPTTQLFGSMKELAQRIGHYIENSKRKAQPFVWTAAPDSIFAKIERRCERISAAAH